MPRKITLKNHKAQAQRYTKRAIVAVIGVLLLVLVLIARLIYLQVVHHKFYSTLSRQNLLNIIPIQPNRGLIYDRNGILLAKNIPIYSLDLIPGRISNINNTITGLKKIIPISTQDISDFHHNLSRYRPYQNNPLKLNLTEQEVATFYVNRYRFPGVNIQTQMMRFYPAGKVMSNVIGYVGRIDARELSEINHVNYSASNYIGKVGIEKYYEKQLHGNVGAEEAEINASGRTVRILKKIPPIPGINIYLTIDSKLQAYAEKILGKNAGAIVAIKPNNGQILALVTKPDYDPNLFVSGMTPKEYHTLVDAKQHPLYNRAIKGLFSPGSTIKPFFSIAALNSNIINPQYEIFDPGWFQIQNTKHIYHDWKRGGHGWVNITKAITVSCDTFFYNLSMKMGIHYMDQVLQAFGFGQKTGVDTTGEVAGIVPSPSWKIHHIGKPWFSGDSVITGIGQGSLLVTPLQLAQATAIIAERGKRFKPHLIKAIQEPDGNIINIPATPEPTIVLENPLVWHTVIHAMQQVVNDPHGTAILFGRNPPYTVAAKTGTAQVFGKTRDEEYSRMNIPKRLRNNHLFIMFAPVDHPAIALVVVIEHASEADKMARKITDFYFKELRKRRSSAKKPN